MRIGFWLAAIFLIHAPAAAQRQIQDSGPIRHQAASAVFPERVGDFRRTSTVSYRSDDSDMSASYALERDENRLLITVYIYPATAVAAAPGSAQTAEVARAMLCRSEFEGVTQAIARAQGQVETVQSGPAAAPEGVAPALALRSIHRFDTMFFGRRQPVRSETRLYCHVAGRWLVKYRATANDGFAGASVELERFIAQGPWPGRALADPGVVAP